MGSLRGHWARGSGWRHCCFGSWEKQGQAASLHRHHLLGRAPEKQYPAAREQAGFTPATLRSTTRESAASQSDGIENEAFGAALCQRVEVQPAAIEHASLGHVEIVDDKIVTFTIEDAAIQSGPLQPAWPGHGEGRE